MQKLNQSAFAKIIKSRKCLKKQLIVLDPILGFIKLKVLQNLSLLWKVNSCIISHYTYWDDEKMSRIFVWPANNYNNVTESTYRNTGAGLCLYDCTDLQIWTYLLTTGWNDWNCVFFGCCRNHCWFPFELWCGYCSVLTVSVFSLSYYVIYECTLLQCQTKNYANYCQERIKLTELYQEQLYPLLILPVKHPSYKKLWMCSTLFNRFLCCHHYINRLSNLIDKPSDRHLA